MASTVLAAQLYTLRDFTKTPADMAVTFKKVKALGYDAVQVSAIGPIAKPELRKLLDDTGLQCVATHVGFNELRDETARVIEEHQILGCKHTAIGGIPNEYKSEDGYKKFAKEGSAVGEKLSKGGLSFSYHNHSFELERYGKKNALEILIEESDPKFLGFEIDTYWIQHGGGDPAAYIRRVKGRIPLLHLKDMVAIKPPDKWVDIVMAEVGEGNLNWPEILKAAKESGVQWYIVEQDTCRRDPFESLGISLKNLKSWGMQ